MNNEAQDKERRAPGFSIHAALRYRVRGDRDWHDGVTETISGTRVLFHGDQMIEPNTPVELTFTLPVKLAGDAGVKVMCRGTTETSGQRSMISVRFSRMRMLRP